MVRSFQCVDVLTCEPSPRPLPSQLMAPLAVDSVAGTDGDDDAGGDPVRIRALRSGSSRHRHRLEALSAIYLQRIVEMLNTGELLPDLTDSGLAVSRVRRLRAADGSS